MERNPGKSNYAFCFKRERKAGGGEAQIVLCPLGLCPKFDLSMEVSQCLGGRGRRVRKSVALSTIW